MRKDDQQPITDSYLAKMRDEVALSWDRAMSDPESEWYVLKIGQAEEL